MGDFNFKNYKFKDLEVWSLGMKIVHEVYKVTKKFPKEELFALTNQIKRTSTSITLNIAEGSGQPTSKGFSVYLHRSKSSVLEVARGSELYRNRHSRKFCKYWGCRNA